MATIAELNIRLGLLTKGFDRELRGVERKMKQAGQQLSSLGADLTAAVSLPLVGLGFAAIKSAGEIEALKLAITSTMTGAGRSTADATAELEALRKIALAPGIDFEQAVRGSIRLQAVGLSAEDARGSLVQLANAIAAAGGTAENLNSVTVQFSQMIAKGQVFTQDLKIIKENLPSIGASMQRAFGTQSAEDLQKMGVSAREFIDAITKDLANAPRVASGIKNSMVNLFVGLQLEAARFGEEINKAFNIGDAADGILNAVKGIVSAFSSLSDGSKKIIVSMAALAAAAGPVLFVFGKLIAFAAPIRTGFLAMGEAVRVLNARMVAANVAQLQLATGYKAITTATTTASAAQQGVSLAFAATAASAEKNKAAGLLMVKSMDAAKASAVSGVGSFNGLTAVIQRATAAWYALNLAQKAFLVGGIVLAIAAVAIVYNELTHELTATEKAQRAVNEVSKQASDDISSERTKVTELVGVLKDQNATRDEQKRALEALKAIAPAYFKDIDTEKIKIGDVDKAVNAYIDSLLRAAKAKRAFARLEELDKLRENIVAAAEPSTWQRIVNGFKAAGNGAVFVGLEAVQLGENFAKLKAEIEAEEKAMREVIKTNGDFVDTAAGASQSAAQIAAAAGKASEAQKEAARQTKLYADALASIAAVAQKGDVLGAEVMSEQAREIESQIERLLENGFKPYSKEIANLRGMLQQLRADTGKGFDMPNLTQQTLGLSLDIPNIPSLKLPDQVVSVNTDEATDKIEAFTELQAAAIEKINEQRRKAHEEELNRIAAEQAARRMLVDAAIDTARTIADSIISIQQGKAKQEIQILEEEYAARIQAAQGNTQQVAALQEELASRKDAIEKKTAKQSQGVAIGQAIVNTAQGVTKALASAPPPFNFALAGLVAAAGLAEITKIKAQAFAKGGVVDRPTLALVGEYAGASNNPEIITPENKLTNVFNDVLNKFEFPTFEPQQQQDTKPVPLPAPVVNIRLGNVVPANSTDRITEVRQTDTRTERSDTNNIERIFEAISSSVFRQSENNISTASSISDTVNEIRKTISVQIERTDTSATDREASATASSIEKAFQSISREVSKTTENNSVQLIERTTTDTITNDFQSFESSVSSTLKEAFSGFAVPKINITQESSTAPADQQTQNISRSFSRSIQNFTLPEMPQIQAPQVNTYPQNIFSSVTGPAFDVGDQPDTLSAVVRGDDLLFILDKAAVRRGRTK